MKRCLSVLLLASFSLVSLPAMAADAPAAPSQAQTNQAAANTTTSAPRDVIVKAIDQITARIKNERKKLQSDPNYAKQLVSEELAGLVDFKRITRLVMGSWFSSASREQKYRFLDVFKQSLIDTYAAGVTLYQGQKIEVLPMEKDDIRGNRAFVRMKMTTDSGTVIPVSYTMVKDDGKWMVGNVIVSGLNLGKTFKQQFAQSAQNFNGDIDKVIDHWAKQIGDNSILKEHQAASSNDKTSS